MAARVVEDRAGWDRLFESALTGVERQTAPAIVRDARRNLAAHPRLYARLAPKFHVERVGRVLNVVCADEIAAIFERGAVPHRIAARFASALRFQWRGAIFYRRAVHHPGQTALHFLRDAAIRVRS